MKTIKFNGERLSIPEDIANAPVSEQELKTLLNAPEDSLLFIRGQRGSQVLKNPILLEDGMEIGSVSDYVEG